MDHFSRVIDLPDEGSTRRLGECLGHHAPASTVLLLSGDLGSGKTTLVQGLGAGLGIPEPITSPTFTLVNEYLDGRLPLYHIDLYRLTGPEVASLDLDEYWDAQAKAPGIVAIEWAERLVSLPPQSLSLALTYAPGGGRRATLGADPDLDVTFLETALGHGLLVDEI
ncbi:MAG TPA: tRNA (adenosine(37)-N6)-threonylcarbamoyltransferase complex ATPase subunit type 1 TsaE [Leptolyngbyaceae cyanobacterium M65_K2018_010]|nr:tRNA (adenosine(37)-N6)-threonylcarbamoyltransferase complex ATPase subunit type 1 TsaE [Leptolyngbyaceae cyanobacterium M65_K2018_010]